MEGGTDVEGGRDVEGGTDVEGKGRERASTMAINSHLHNDTPLSLPRRHLIGSSSPDDKTNKTDSY